MKGSHWARGTNEVPGGKEGDTLPGQPFDYL